MKVLKVRSSHKNSNSKKKQSQFSIIFILPSQYRSHSVLLNSAVHCPRWFLSMGSRRLHSMQWGSGEDVYPSNHAHRTVEILQLPFF